MSYEICVGAGGQPAAGKPGGFGDCPCCPYRVYIRMDGTVGKHPSAAGHRARNRRASNAYYARQRSAQRPS